MGGDFNMDPAQLTASTWPVAMHASIVATNNPTYHSGKAQTLIDYFVASDAVLPGYRHISTVPENDKETFRVRTKNVPLEEG